MWYSSRPEFSTKRLFLNRFPIVIFDRDSVIFLDLVVLQEVFSKLCNLYGNYQNIRFLSHCGKFTYDREKFKRSEKSVSSFLLSLIIQLCNYTLIYSHWCLGITFSLATGEYLMCILVLVVILASFISFLLSGEITLTVWEV